MTVMTLSGSCTDASKGECSNGVGNTARSKKQLPDVEA